MCIGISNCLFISEREEGEEGKEGEEGEDGEEGEEGVLHAAAVALLFSCVLLLDMCCM